MSENNVNGNQTPKNQQPENQPPVNQQPYQQPPVQVKKPIYKKWWFWVIIVVVVFGIIGSQVEDNGSDDNSSKKEVVATTEKEKATEKQKETKATTTKSAKKLKKEYIAKCETIDYKSLARNPNKYKGNKYKFTGEVIQVQEGLDDSVELRINVTKETYEYIDEVTYTDTIYATVELDDDEDRILESDIITIYGECDGKYSYESVMGSSVTLPKIDIEYFEIN